MIVLSVFFSVMGGEVQALEKSILLEKGLRALQNPMEKLSFSLDTEENRTDSEMVPAPVMLAFNDSIYVKWHKNLPKGGFFGFEGNYQLDASIGSVENNPLHEQNAPKRETFTIRAAMGVTINEKSRLYLVTGASNVGLHIKENRYQRDADFYVGFGFELNLSEDLRLRAEYNLTNYGKNWLRQGFADIESQPPSEDGFLTRLLMRF